MRWCGSPNRVGSLSQRAFSSRYAIVDGRGKPAAKRLVLQAVRAGVRRALRDDIESRALWLDRLWSDAYLLELQGIYLEDVPGAVSSIIEDDPAALCLSFGGSDDDGVC